MSTGELSHCHTVTLSHCHTVTLSLSPSLPSLTTNVITQIPGDKSRPGSPTYRSLHGRHSAGRLYPLSQRSRLQKTSCCLLQSGKCNHRKKRPATFHLNKKIFHPTFSSIQENKKEDFTRAKLDFEECSQLGILIDKEPRNASNT